MKTFIICLLLVLSLPLEGQVVVEIAGGGSSVDGTPASTASIYDPAGIACDSRGNLFFSQGIGNKIRRIDDAGIITTIAGSGAAGFGGDGGIATAAQLNEPCGITVDSLGNLIIADCYNNRIRRVDVSTDVITTIVGDTAGFAGDGGMASAALLHTPNSVCFDSHWNLYIGDLINYRVRKVDRSGVISTFAGNGAIGSDGDGGPATAARIYPWGMCFDRYDNLYISEYGAGLETIRKIDTNGIIKTIAGNTASGVYNGDNIPATSATLDPGFLQFGDSEKLYISDVYNNRVRFIDRFGIIHTIIGNGADAYSGDDGAATAAEISEPSGLAFDACKNLNIGQINNPRIRKILFDSSCSLVTLGAKLPSILEISLSPNPTSGAVMIASRTNLLGISIIDLTGQTIYHQSTNSTKTDIDFSSLPPGLYLVAILDEEGNKTIKKVIKQ